MTGFTIDKVSWHTNVKGNPELRNDVIKRFTVVVEFLQRSNLTVRTLLSPGAVPDDDFVLHSTDLTEEGLEVMKRGYDTWLKKIVNKRKDITDLRCLEQALRDVRSS